MSQEPHVHKFENMPTIDQSGFENVCLSCGTVKRTTITEFDKLSGCLSAEEYKNLPFGPATPVALESFLLPTLTQTYCRDKFVNESFLAPLRIYTALQRLCQQHNIPKVYCDEAMRRLLKSKKGVHSKYAYIRWLIEVIGEEPRLRNRIPELEPLLVTKRNVKRKALISKKVKKKQCMNNSSTLQ